MVKKYSVNPKLNRYLLQIQDQLLQKGSTVEESISIIKRYKNNFPKEPDYSLAQHGGMCVSPYDVRELMESCGYVATDKLSGETVWDRYLKHVGYVARILLKHNTSN